MPNQGINILQRGLYQSPLLFLLLLISCRTIQPTAPGNNTKQVPESPKTLSTASIPVTIDLGPYFQSVEKEIPKTFSGKEQNCEGVSFSYTFYRDPIEFGTNNNQLYYSVDGKYALQLNYCPSCTYFLDKNGTCISPRIYASCGIKEPKRRVHVSYSTTLDINEKFQFTSTTRLSEFETIDPCQITLFQYDATSKIKEEVQVELKALEKEIDKELASYPLRKDLQEIWNEMGTTSLIEDYGYLNFAPAKIQLTPLKLENNKAHLTAYIGFYPKFSTDPLTDQKTALPNQSEFAVKNGFEVYLDTKIGYDTLSALLQKELGGDTLVIKKNVIRFDTIQTYGSQDKLIIAVQFSGKKSGKIYLSCTPKVDPTSQNLLLEKVDFDVDTKHVLLKSARWLLHPIICRTIEEKSKMNLTPYLVELKKLLTEQLNTELTTGVFLKGSCNTIKIESLLIDQKGIISRVKVTGNLEVSM